MRYLKSFIANLVSLPLAVVVYSPVYFIIDVVIYPFLNEINSDIFPTFLAVSQPEEYKTLDSILSVAALFLTVFIISYFRHYLDNERYETVIKKTDGVHKVKEIYPFYFKRYFAADAINAFICPAIYITVFLFIPKKIIERYIPLMFDVAENAVNSMTPYSTPNDGSEINILAVSLAILFIFLTTASANLAVPAVTLKKWGAGWLSMGAVTEE